jgi:uncharacterized protein (UPF0333 family)
MARKKSGGEGGNAILVVFLVLFILLAIGLGVAYWSGQDKVAAAGEAEKKAKTDIEAAKKAQESAELKLKMYKAFFGTASEDDRTSLQSPGTHEAALKEEHTALMKAVDDNIRASVNKVAGEPDGKRIEELQGRFTLGTQEVFTWPWPAQGVLAKQPSPGPLLDRMVRVVAERERTYHESVVQRKNADDQAKAFAEKKKEYTDALTNLNNQVQAQIKKLGDTIDSVEKEKGTAIETFTTKGDESRKMVAQKQAVVDEKDTLLREERAKLENVSRQLQTLLDKQNEIDQERRGVFAVNVPHGEIVSRTLRGNDKLVEISIGSDAGVRPGQTFTVQPSSARTEGLRRERQTQYDAEGRLVVSDAIASKGTIEVVSVLGPRLSSARITGESNEVRDSILKGDLLYNPLFRKNAKDHVVLVGIFDVNGDGIDDITEVARNLSKRGAIVDGYFDLSTNKWESLDPNVTKPGPTAVTTYVVRGWDFDTTSGDALSNAKGVLRTSINTALTDAKTKGAQEVKASKFFAEIGYPVSPSVSDETVAAAAVKYLKETPAPSTPK